MALSGNTVLEVRRTGSDTNGGGFVTGAAGFDYSLFDAAAASVTNAVANGTTTITSATANFVGAIGNIIYLQGGTGSLAAGWYQVMTNANTTTITVDRTVAAGTGITLKLGGALATPGQAAAIAQVALMTTYIKYDASPYVITTATTNVAGGCLSPLAGTSIHGYETTRAPLTLGENRPTLQLAAAVSTATILSNINAVYFASNLILDGNSQTASRGAQMSGDLFNVKAMNCLTSGMAQNSAGHAILCEVANCQTQGMSFNGMAYCYAHDCTSLVVNTGGIACPNGGVVIGCISKGHNRSGFSGQGTFVDCIAYGNTEQGFNPLNSMSTCVNCIAESNTLYGFRNNASPALLSLINCASYGNGSGRVLTGGRTIADINPVAGSGSFFTNAAAGNFTLNNTAGAGAAARSAGFPSTFHPLTSTVSYPDIGPTQHQDAPALAAVIRRSVNVVGR